MSACLRASVYGICLLGITACAAAADPPDALRQRIQQVLDDRDLSGAERFQALRQVLDEEEAKFLTENAKRWVSALGGSDLDARREAREQLADAAELALPALEVGARTGDREASTVCLELIDRLARSEEYSESALQALERLADDDSEATAARAATVLAAARSLHGERDVQSVIDMIESIGGRVDSDRRDSGKVTGIVLLQGGGFDDSMMSRLAILREIDRLWLHNTKITDAGMVHLAKHENLRNLSLDSARITDEGLAAVSELTSLEHLSLQETEVTDEGLQHLLGLRNLTRLDLNRTQVTDVGLVQLKVLPNLERLSLGLGGSVTDDGLRVLREFPRLRSLSLGTDFTDRGVEHLTGIANLERLAFINCEGVTDAGLRQLSSMTTLKHLAIYSRSGGITEAGLQELQQALPELELGGFR